HPPSPAGLVPLSRRAGEGFSGSPYFQPPSRIAGGCRPPNLVRGEAGEGAAPIGVAIVAVRSPILNVMGNAALKAARGLIRDFGEVEQLQVSVKGAGEFVSTADLRAERTLKAELKKARPGYAMLFEESGAEAGSDPRHRWIVDPLDGTTNFLHGIPHFAISI